MSSGQDAVTEVPTPDSPPNGTVPPYVPASALPGAPSAQDHPPGAPPGKTHHFQNKLFSFYPQCYGESNSTKYRSELGPE